MDIIWDGTQRHDSLTVQAANVRNELADAAKQGNWPRVFAILQKEPEWVNSHRLEGKSGYVPLHQAAYLGVPEDIIERLLAFGAWRSLQNSRGERPVDIAERFKHLHLLNRLIPAYHHHVPNGILLKIQHRFYDVIQARAGDLVVEHQLRLPQLEVLLELEEPKMWFPVPGMHGGFHYWLDPTGVDAKLIVESWSRIVEGSGQRHVITATGSELVEEGFV